MSFDQFDPPVEDKALSYLKKTRFSDVSFSENSICTVGHPWKTLGVMSTDCNHGRLSLVTKETRGFLTPFQIDCLRWLSDQLKLRGRQCEKLAYELSCFAERGRCSRDESPAVQHMRLMTEEVVKAIRRQEPLRIARLSNAWDAGAVFVNVRNDIDDFVTSWHHEAAFYDREQYFFVSLGVKVSEHGYLSVEQ